MRIALTIIIFLSRFSLLPADTGFGPAFIGTPYKQDQIGEYGFFDYIEHPTIEMTYEEVAILLYPLGASVYTEFHFTNTGDATTVNMVYPIQDNLKVAKAFNMKIFEDDFDKRVDYEIIGEYFDDGELAYQLWASWDMSFETGEEKTVLVQYEAPYGFSAEEMNIYDKWERVASDVDNVNGNFHSIARYVLYTGASWKGAIGGGKISFILMDGIYWEDLIDPDGKRINGEGNPIPDDGMDVKIEPSALIFEFSDYEPFIKNYDELSTGTILRLFVGIPDDRFDFSEESSSLPGDQFGYYGGENLCDSSLNTVWSEGIDGTGEGEWVKLVPYYDDYDRYYDRDLLKGILVYNGFFGSETLYKENNRPHILNVGFYNDGNKVESTNMEFFKLGSVVSKILTPEKRYHLLDKPQSIDEIKLTIKRVERGIEFDDTCIAEVVPIYADPRTHHSASSTLVEDYSDIFRYHPIKIDDSDSTTCWVEGVSGSGVGEWVEFQWDYPKDLVAVKILPGFAGSKALWRENGRPKKITVECFSGDESILKVPFDIEDVMEEQNFYLTNDVVYDCSRLRITIDKVNPGDKYDDTCISEVGFLEF